MAESEPLVIAPGDRPPAAIVAFLEIAKAPQLLASLASKIPSDIVPMPIDRFSAFCRCAQGPAVALHGLVVCVPQDALAAEDRAIVDDLGRLIPVLRVFEDPREAGRTFFARCRAAVPRIPRSVERLEFRRPVAVVRADGSDVARLLLAENVSSGGLFLRAPCPSCRPDEVLRLRFPGLTEVPEVAGRVRWVRPSGQRGRSPGYGCAFESPQDPAVRRLLSQARAVLEPNVPPPLPPPPGLPGRPRRR